MARAPRKAKAKAKKETEAPETTLLFPPKSVVTDLAELKRDAKKRTTSISGTLGEKIGKACTDKHVDRKALSIACQLDAMDDERLHITYFHLLRYMGDLGIPNRARIQEELFDEHQTPPTPGRRGAGDQASRIGDVARQVVEQAGGTLPG